MPKRIAIIDGHPDSDQARFCHALVGAYAEGASSVGHLVNRLTVAEIDVPILRKQQEWDGAPTHTVQQCQDAIGWAEHLVIVYPLWLGTMPALLKAFLEQTLRPGFAIRSEPGKMWDKLLKGKSARIVVTMGMPASIYRWYFRARSLSGIERNVLGFAGIGPIKETLIGGVGTIDEAKRRKWLGALRALGRNGD